MKKAFFLFVFLFFSFLFFSFSSTVRAIPPLEAYHGDIKEYRWQMVPQGTALNTNELIAISDQNPGTAFTTGYPDFGGAAILFHFNLGVIDPAQTKVTFSWTGSLTSTREKGEVVISFFDQTEQTWYNKRVLITQINKAETVSLALGFDQNGNSGTGAASVAALNVNNLVGPTGDLWLMVWSEYADPVLTTTETSLQVTVPRSFEPETTLTLTGTAGTNGWFTASPVTVSLPAIPAGGTITKIEYSLNSDPLQTFTDAFPASTEEITKIQYRSYDSWGNTEGLKWGEIKIDTHPPQIEIHTVNLVDINNQYQQSLDFSSLERATLKFAPSILCEDIWGTDSVFYYQLDGGPVTQLSSGFVKAADPTPGLHLLEFWGVDRAGQESSHFRVTFTLDFSDYPRTLDASGGTINTYYGDTLTLPAGALTEKINVTTEVISLEGFILPLPREATLLPRAYQFGPAGTTFAEPATVVFQYTDEDLDGGDPANLGVYIWDSILNRWIYQQGVVDTVTQTLTVQLDHFSLFILAIDETSFEWQPPLSTEEIYQVENGRTLPIKFAVTDLEGNFVADESVTLEVYNSDDQLVAEPEIAIQKKQYHFNFKTKEANLAEGTYTIKIGFSSPELLGSSSILFTLYAP